LAIQCVANELTAVLHRHEHHRHLHHTRPYCSHRRMLKDNPSCYI